MISPAHIRRMLFWGYRPISSGQEYVIDASPVVITILMLVRVSDLLYVVTRTGFGALNRTVGYLGAISILSEGETLTCSGVDSHHRSGKAVEMSRKSFADSLEPIGRMLPMGRKTPLREPDVVRTHGGVHRANDVGVANPI